MCSFRGTRIDLPKAMRSRAIKVAHEDYEGVTDWRIHISFDWLPLSMGKSRYCHHHHISKNPEMLDYPHILQTDNAKYFTPLEFRDVLQLVSGAIQQNPLKVYLHVLSWGKKLKRILTMLQKYRAAPHYTTEKTPAQLLINQELWTIRRLASSKHLTTQL